MRKFVLFVLVASAFLIACKTRDTVVEESPTVQETPKPNPPIKQVEKQPAKKVEAPVKVPEPEPKVEEPVKEPEPEIEEPIKQPEPEITPEPEPKVEEPKKPEPVKQPEPAEEKLVHEEYLRSISGMESGEVSREDFEADKRKILEIIDKLADVMNKYNYDEWLTYIGPDSITYWQDQKNLANASQRLPVSVRAQLPSKRLKTLRDYFSFVFVPARKDRVVDEIRYISPESVKAVDVTDDSDVIYYNFKKIDGKWFVHLPAGN